MKVKAPVEQEVVEIPPGAYRLERGTKFWQIQRTEKRLDIVSGKIGTRGEKQKIKHRDEWDARTDHDKQLSAKLKQGYQIVIGGPRIALPPSAENKPLEKQIRDDPASDDKFMVYTDWLQQQGDLRGELAVLNARRAQRPNDKRLANAERKLLWENRAYFYGALAPYVSPPERTGKYDEQVLAATWRHGWLDSLGLRAFEDHNFDHKTPILTPPNTARLIADLPNVTSARFLRELVVGWPVAIGRFSFVDSVKELVKVAPSLPLLRRLTLGDFTGNESELSWSELGKLDALWPLVRRLEYLKLRAGSMTIGNLVLPELRELRVETGGLDRKSAASIAQASFPKLETLSVWFGDPEYGCTATLSDVRPILDGKKLPAVRHLGLKNTTFGDELVPLLVRSRIAKQLTTLDISMSHFTDAGMRLLAAHRDAFPQLEVLDVSRCLLDTPGQKLARKFAKQVHVDRQENAADWNPDDPQSDYARRYAAIGE